MNIKKKMMALALVASLSVGTAYVAKDATDAKFWLGVSYVGAKQGKLNTDQSAAIGLIGIAQSAIHGAAWGAAFGPAGAVIGGAAAGL